MKATAQNKIKQLQSEILLLKKENASLKKSFNRSAGKSTVTVPKQIKPIFDKAEKLVGRYFKSLKFSPSKGSIEINKERYVLVRASALSHEFLNSIKQLYKDRAQIIYFTFLQLTQNLGQEGFAIRWLTFL